VTSLCQEETIAMRRCRRGSSGAFEVFVNRYMKDAYFIALGLVGNREDAMDLSQEAFIRAYRNIKHLKPDRRFFPWFYQILKNLCISHLEKEGTGRQALSMARIARSRQLRRITFRRRLWPEETSSKTKCGRQSVSWMISIAR